jgi:CHAT domain-containing protein
VTAADAGLGEDQPGEGIIGLRWAFAITGAGTVATTLWPVPDRATRALMIEFYRRFVAGDTVTDALGGAQVATRERHADPYVWGAFVSHGDPTSALR